MVEHSASGNDCHGIGSSDACPYTIGAPNSWEDEKERYKEEKLAADREENTLLCHADTLEEVSCDDLKTNQWTDEDNESHAIDGEFCELLILCEKADRDVREELTNDKGNRHHNSSIDDGIFQHQVHTIEFACTSEA